jgi:hypothetical protein
MPVLDGGAMMLSCWEGDYSLQVKFRLTASASTAWGFIYRFREADEDSEELVALNLLTEAFFILLVSSLPRSGPSSHDEGTAQEYDDETRGL